MLKGVRAFVRLPAGTRAMALEATLDLLVARLLVRYVPMRLWRRRIDTVGEPAAAAQGSAASQRTATGSGKTALPGARGVPGEPAPRHMPLKVGRVVRKVARRLPFRARCLPQAMAAQWMLRRRGIGSRLVFGTRRDTTPAASLEFHAWLIVSGECVIGAQEVETFRVLAPPETAGRRPGASASAAPRGHRSRLWDRRGRRTAK